jgi:hypothetical protein
LVGEPSGEVRKLLVLEAGNEVAEIEIEGGGDNEEEDNGGVEYGLWWRCKGEEFCDSFDLDTLGESEYTCGEFK